MSNFNIIQNNAKKKVFLVEERGNLIIIKENNSDDPDIRKMLKNEASVLKVLNDINISPKLKNIYEDNTRIQLQEEFIEGNLLNDIKLATFDDKLKMMSNILEAVLLLHNKGVIHCDLKPNNIIVTESNEIKIVDYEISCLSNKNTFKGYGSIPYCSLEQLKENEVSFKTDIYALGIIFYEICFGFLPFDGSKEEIKKKKQENKFNLSNNENLNNIFLKSINTIENRYNSVKEFIEDMEIFKKIYNR